MNRKKPIDKHLRYLVWNDWIPDSIKGPCWCCGEPISFDSFHCGHIEPECKGGLTIRDNLKPICQGCNLGCGKKNLAEYKKTVSKKHDTREVKETTININEIKETTNISKVNTSEVKDDGGVKDMDYSDEELETILKLSKLSFEEERKKYTSVFDGTVIPHISSRLYPVLPIRK